MFGIWDLGFGILEFVFLRRGMFTFTKEGVVKLEMLLQDVDVREWSGVRDVDISSVAYHSGDVRKGGLFCTWKGEKSDGHQYIAQAIERGAAAIVAEKIEPSFKGASIRVAAGRPALAWISANFFSRPAEKLDVIGVTGTNGKTSTAILIRHFLENAKRKTGLIGTIGYDFGKGMMPAERTTPEGLELQTYFDTMTRNGCRSAVMEVSSHALDQGRVEGISYRAAVFTNLTRDHLDYHGTMENYFYAKQKLFTRLSSGSVAVLNADDEWSAQIAAHLPNEVRVIRYGISSKETAFFAEKIQCRANGTQFVLKTPEGDYRVETPWLGMFSVLNILAAVSTGFALGLRVEDMSRWITTQSCVTGRMETVPHDGNFAVVVDYAHTDDAVRKALQALRPLAKKKLKVLIGCGGNRDKTKRPLMARAACELADEVAFTSDNPRDEDPMQILYDMLAGVRGMKNFHVYPEREEAIREILRGAQEGDVILIAGKGHETTQEICGQKFPFSDREVAWKILQEANHEATCA
ncbi:MAG: UDP-N-acetylmuramoyl-L-alanyl-D-glutamate--2,6-diaminopimelate ligase [Verrucomicrobiota bacterium]